MKNSLIKADFTQLCEMTEVNVDKEVSNNVLNCIFQPDLNYLTKSASSRENDLTTPPPPPTHTLALCHRQEHTVYYLS